MGLTGSTTSFCRRRPTTLVPCRSIALIATQTTSLPSEVGHELLMPIVPRVKIEEAIVVDMRPPPHHETPVRRRAVHLEFTSSRHPECRIELAVHVHQHVTVRDQLSGIAFAWEPSHPRRRTLGSFCNAL